MAAKGSWTPIRQLTSRPARKAQLILPASQRARPLIDMHSRELADLYAILTLHDYLAPREPGMDFRFRVHTSTPRVKELLAGRRAANRLTLDDKTGDFYEEPSLSVIPFSDLIPSTRVDRLTLQLDIALLKNAVPASLASDKRTLRKRYGVRSSRPVVLFARPEWDERRVNRLAGSICDKAQVIMYTGGDYRPSSKVLDGATIVTGEGHLKEYYALADIAVDCHMLEPLTDPLHNFVEATAGGPLFAVRPTHGGGQYGYRQLVECGVIREFGRLSDLSRALRSYIDNPVGAETHHARRAAHLERTRDQYLSVAQRVMKIMLGRDVALPQSDVHIEVDGTTPTLTLVHPDSEWRKNTRGYRVPFTGESLKRICGLFRQYEVSYDKAREELADMLFGKLDSMDDFDDGLSASAAVTYSAHTKL